MYRLKPIRRPKTRKPPAALLGAAEAAFYMLFAVALVLGGGRAFAGIPALAGLILPSGVSEAQASDAPRRAYARLPVDGPIAPSSFAPQILYPVVAHDFPDWLIARVAPPAPVEPPSGPPKIAIVIDDLGADLAHTDRALRLPKEVGLSFLPYADATPWLATEAERGGHEVLLHMPMQAEGDHDPGPLALTVGLPEDEIHRRLAAALARVPGAIGLNNHMGSRFTESRAALIPVVEDLAARHLLFFDSRTIATTQVVTVAHAFGVASAGRDVFLDDEQTANAVALELQELETRARQQGVAIAIGHPHDVTLRALADWTARAASRGFVLVPLSEAIRLKTEREARQALAAR
jgi:uncharacterized protein